MIADIIESMMKEISDEIESERIKLNLLRNEGIFLIMPAVLNPVARLFNSR